MPTYATEWNSKIIAQQIKALNEFKKIKNWNIGIFSVKSSEKYSNIKFKKDKIDVTLQQRSSKTPYNNFFQLKHYLIQMQNLQILIKMNIIKG